MENIIPKISSSLSKMWIKVLNIENSLFPDLKESLRIEEFSHKESKRIKILDFAQIEKFVNTTSLTNPPKDRKQIVRAFIAKSVYNIQTTRDLSTLLTVAKVGSLSFSISRYAISSFL